MKTQDLLNQILGILSTVKENHEKLQKILLFLEDEIYEEPEEPEVPGKYIKVIPVIADSIDSGFVCFLNPDTLEHEDFPQMMINDQHEYEMETDESTDEITFKHDKWEHCITFEPLESYESFKIMEKFAENLNDNYFQEKLFNALNRRKPFANFKVIVETSKYRQDWFDFKKQMLEIHVKDLLLMYLQKKKIIK